MNRLPTTTEVMWAMAQHAHEPEVFGDLLILLAWLECIGRGQERRQTR